MKTTETTAPDTTAFYQEPTHDEIALSAFLLWESEGRQPDREMEYWIRAESQLRQSRLKKAEAAAEQAALPWPRPSRSTTRAIKKAAEPTAQMLNTPARRATSPKSTRRAVRA
jgi:hypothetical protein